MGAVDHILILAISETGPTIWTLAVVTVNTAAVTYLCLRGRDDDR